LPKDHQGNVKPGLGLDTFLIRSAFSLVTLADNLVPAPRCFAMSHFSVVRLEGNSPGSAKGGGGGGTRFTRSPESDGVERLGPVAVGSSCEQCGIGALSTGSDSETLGVGAEASGQGHKATKFSEFVGNG